MRGIAGSIENLSQNGNTLRTPTLVEKMMINCGFGVYGFGDNTISKIGNVLHNLTSLSRVTEVFSMVFFLIFKFTTSNVKVGTMQILLGS